MSSSSLISYSNHFYAGIANTAVSKEQIYTASAGKENLSVYRQVSGIVTIPTGTTLTSSLLLYLPIINEDGIQIVIPLNSIVHKSGFCAMPFGSLEPGILQANFKMQARVSTTPYTLAVPYTVGTEIQVSQDVRDANLNILYKAMNSFGNASGIYGVILFYNWPNADYTTTQDNKFRITFYYSDPQDLNK
jgi:hypothetical protein